MDLGVILALVSATAILIAIPGPNIAFVIANTLAYGFRYGAVTVLGTTLGVALQLAVVVAGLAALLAFAASAFVWIKWIGVAYLLFLGISAWRKGVADLDTHAPEDKPLRTLFWQGFLIATLNPKTLIFHAAFLPQFVPSDAGAGTLSILALIYISMVLVGDTLWAACAQTARPALAKLGRLRHKLTGALFFASGVGLALARIDR